VTVALSGGADSAVLAWSLADRDDVVAVTIDHGLPGSAALVAAAERIASRLGLRHRVVTVAPRSASEGDLRTARLAARISEARAGFAGQTPLLSRASLDLAALDVAVDAAKARRDLGWSPRPLEDRVKETMAWYVDRYRVRRAPLPIKASGAFA